jgi:4-hydroxy-3-polyprenylbenzoate decarboxylase
MAPVVLAISGASAQPLAQRALQLLLGAGEEVEVVMSRGAIAVWQAELGIQVPGQPEAQEQFWRDRTATDRGTLRCHRWNDQASAIASGSYRTRGMVILPASMGTVDFLVVRIFDLLGDELAPLQRWQGPLRGSDSPAHPA